MPYEEYGTLIETMFSQFSIEEIPENIRKYKERMDSLFSSSARELTANLESFDEKERNYLNSKCLDDFFKIYKEDYPLQEAIKNNMHEKVIETYLRFILDYNLYFYLAAEYGNFYTVKQLFPKISYQRKSGALTLASSHGYLEIVNFLLENYEFDDNNYVDAFISAVKNGQEVVFDRFIEIRPNIIHAKNNLAIVLASKNGHIHIVNKLLEMGADIASAAQSVHAQNGYALIAASKNGHIAVVNRLLEAGVDIHTRNGDALGYASNNGQFEVVKLLLEKGANVHTGGNWAIRLASFNGHFDVVNLLIENGADVNMII